MPDPTNPSGGIMGGLESILGNPLTQAALSGYLNYIGTPRYMRRGGAIANAGLGALSAFDQAEQMKLQGPLRQAQARKLQAEAGKTEATTAAIGSLSPEQRQQYALGGGKSVVQTQTNQAANKALANSLTAQIKAGGFGKPGSDVYNRAMLVSQSIANSSEPPPKWTELNQFIMLGPEQLQHLQAQTGQAQASAALSQGKLGEIPVEEAQKQAATEASHAETALRRAEIPTAEATTGLREAQTRAVPGHAAGAQINKVNTDLGRFFTSNPAGVTTDHEALVARATEYASELNPDVPKEQIRAAAEALTPASGALSGVAKMFGGGGEPTPENTPTPEHGPNPTATGPDGKKIRWNGTAWVPVP